MPLVMCLSLCEYKWGSAKTIFSCWTWLFSLLSLFCNFYSFCLCVSEENESDIWNKIALINESNDGKWLAVFQSPLPNIKQVITSYEYEKCEKFHVGFKITVFYFYPHVCRKFQVDHQLPAVALGAQTDLLPIFMKKASYGNILNTLFCHFYSFCISEENESDIWNKIALKWIERWKIHETKRSAAVSSMWTLAQMTQMVVFRYAHSIFLG